MSVFRVCVVVLGVLLATSPSAQAQDVKRDIPYVESADKLQNLDVYSPPNAKTTGTGRCERRRFASSTGMPTRESGSR